MDVTKEQVASGLIRYVDSYVIPVLPTSGKWVVGTALALVDVNNLYASLEQNAFVKSLDVLHDGLLNVDRLAQAAKLSAEKYGNLQIQVPLVGSMTFTKDDIDKLKNCICGGN